MKFYIEHNQLMYEWAEIAGESYENELLNAETILKENNIPYELEEVYEEDTVASFIIIIGYNIIFECKEDAVLFKLIWR